LCDSLTEGHYEVIDVNKTVKIKLVWSVAVFFS
jgi:hypothetical protein